MESFTSRVLVSDLLQAVKQFANGSSNSTYVNVEIDDRGALTISPSVESVTLENVSP